MSAYNEPSGACVAASCSALSAGVLALLIGLWAGALRRTERGYDFTVVMYGRSAAATRL